MSRVTGSFQQLTIDGARVAAFIPETLPPRNPDFALEPIASMWLDRAEQSLRRLGMLLDTAPSLDGIVHAYLRKEAVASARIAGGQVSLVGLLADEAGVRLPRFPDRPRYGRRRASEGLLMAHNALAALAHARGEISRTPYGPRISVRRLNRTHHRLLRGLRGENRVPGRLRSIPISIPSKLGELTAPYVPPPPSEIGHLLENLDVFESHGAPIPRLVQLAMIFAQLLNIHPYFEGNGRLARMLVALLLERSGYLRAPVLCLSTYLWRRRADVQRLLSAIRSDGDWESWARFFLEGLSTTAEDGLETARRLLEQVERDRDRLLRWPSSSVAGLRLFALLPRQPIVSIPMVEQLLETTAPTAGKAVELLEDMGILKEVSGRQRDRVYSYSRFLALLDARME